MDMNNVKEKAFLPTHLLWGILGLLVIGIGMVQLFMPALAQPQDVIETDSARNTQDAALLGLTPGAAASVTVRVATRDAEWGNAAATRNARPTTEAYGRHVAQWSLTATAWYPFRQATDAAYVLTEAVTHQAQTATWQARGPMWQMENDPLVKIADILQQDMVEQSSPILADTPTAEPIDWDVATPVLEDPGLRNWSWIGPLVVRFLQLHNIGHYRRSYFEQICWRKLQCGLIKDERHTACTVSGWETCLHGEAIRYFHYEIVIPEAQQTATASVEQTQAAYSDATSVAAGCIVGNRECAWRTHVAKHQPQSTATPRPPSHELSWSQRRERALRNCYPGGKELSDQIAAGEAAGYNMGNKKKDFEGIYGSPCQCEGLCVH